MSKPRITTFFVNFAGTPPQVYNWTCPAGVTFVFVSIQNSASLTNGQPRYVPVVPGTTYAITVNSKATWTLTTGANSFGSLFNFDSGNMLLISWVE